MISKLTGFSNFGSLAILLLPIIIFLKNYFSSTSSGSGDIIDWAFSVPVFDTKL